MKRNTIFPGANERLLVELGTAFETAKEPGDEFTAVVNGIRYGGPVKQQAGNLNWYIKRTALAPREAQAKRSAPAKAAPKKAAPKKKAAKKKAAPKK